ncbi:hypothetical protein LOZ66_002085 [Ophidiomyces ophidiicola]|nr:hypothetical protein LOZ66_002085 [Ophidiomyces ophidiicola]
MLFFPCLTGLLLYTTVYGKPADLTYASGIIFPATAPVASGISFSRATGAYTGIPTATGALTGSSRGTAISGRPPGPEATRYQSDGRLHDPQPAPYVPGGGLGTNGTMPVYNVQSDYDYQSVALLLYASWLQLDLFDTGLSQFSQQDFIQAGLTANDFNLIQFMRGEVLGQVTVLKNILGSSAPTRCGYRYPFNTLPEFNDFSQKMAKAIESTVYGFAPHLDARGSAQVLLQAIAITARQQLIFRQFEGLFPIPVWFETGIPQSWAWTLIAPYISFCPGINPRLVWQNFPALRIINQPNPFSPNATAGTNTTLGPGLGAANISSIPPQSICLNSTCAPSISSNRTTPLSQPDQIVKLSWDKPGMRIGPNNSYTTTSMGKQPAYLAWVTQLNITYTPITGASNSSNGTSAQATQPRFETFAGDPGVNGTVFVAITDANLFVTPFNLSLLNPHIVAGPAVYQAG